MKISAIFSVAAAAKVSRHARSQTLFDEIFGGQSNSAERSNFFATDSLYQVIQFYLGSSGQNPLVADDMTSYGCWCQLRNQAAQGIVPGHGAPVDALDELCKAWSQCRSCTTIDSADGSCDPNEVPYEIGFDPATMRVDCQFNDSDCAVNSCKCDENLAHSLIQAFDNFNTDFVTSQDGSGFDHANECKAIVPNDKPNSNNGNGGNQAQNEVQCCGTYPNRFSFNTQPQYSEGARSCCGDVTYNTNKHECCNNSFLGAIGECT